MVSRVERGPVADWMRTADRWLIGSFIALMVIGLVMALAASPAVAERLNLSIFHFVNRQALMLIPTAALMIAAQCGVGILDDGPSAQLPQADTFQLTPREWDCLRLIAQGFRDADVARLIGISPTTARYYIDQAVRKMNAANRTHAVALAAQLGLLGPIGI